MLILIQHIIRLKIYKKYQLTGHCLIAHGMLVMVMGILYMYMLADCHPIIICGQFCNVVSLLSQCVLCLCIVFFSILDVFLLSKLCRSAKTAEPPKTSTAPTQCSMVKALPKQNIDIRSDRNFLTVITSVTVSEVHSDVSWKTAFIHIYLNLRVKAYVEFKFH